MKPVDRMRRFFENATISTNPAGDKSVLADAVGAAGLASGRRPVPGGSRMWRLTMRSPIAKLAVAAALILASLAALHLWRGTESGVALADVLAKVEQVQAYTYRMEAHSVGSRPSGPMEIEITVLVASEYGTRADRHIHMGDPNAGVDMHHRVYTLPKQNLTVRLMPETKKYVRRELDDDWQQEDARSMIEKVLACQYEELGRSEIEGIEVEGFRTTDPSYWGGLFKEVDVTIWVDVKRWLPVRLESVTSMDGQVRTKSILYDFQWDVPVAASEFEDVIPADFTAAADDMVPKPAKTEETAVEGLRLALHFNGAYPRDLAFTTLVEAGAKIRAGLTPEAKKFMDELSEIASEDERNARYLQKFRPIQAIGLFHRKLSEEQKDPAYYGDVVTPGDPGHVLLRWKLSENEYRVIFADLHAETVAPEALAVLEAALTK